MPAKKRFKTKHPGIHYIEAKAAGSGRKERVYYIVYRKNGKLIEEKAGRQFQDGMTPAKARRMRIDCIQGRRLSRKEMRDTGNEEKKPGADKREKKAIESRLLEEKWLLFANSATDGFNVWDSELNMVELNDAALAAYPPGMDRRDILGKNISEILPKSNETCKAENFRDVVKTGKPFTFKDVTLPRRFGGIHVNVKAFKVGDGLGSIITNVTDRVRKERELKERKAELEDKTRDLEEVNAALKVLLKRREEDKKDLEEKILYNVKELIMPHLEKVKMGKMSDAQKLNLDIIEANLNDIVSPFSKSLSSKYFDFTPSELQIANLIKYGRTTKEIAEILHLSVNTIQFHRSNIRRKIGISKQKTNLRSYLQVLN